MSEVDIKVLDLPRQRFGDGLRDHVPPVVVRTQELAGPAKVAVEMATHWGMIAGTPDGEDSAGRQKLRLLSPDELSNRACQTAQALWMRFERLGWLVAIPEPRLRQEEEKEKA